MKCSNPACGKETFTVTVQHKLIDPEHPDRLPVKLFCRHCGKPVKAWITNEQMKQLLVKYSSLASAYEALAARIYVTVKLKPKKPWWKIW